MIVSAIMEQYRNKLVTADEAVKVVKSGDNVQYGEFVMNPFVLDAALAKRKDDLQDVVVRTTTMPLVPQIVQADPNQEAFTYVDLHFSGASRKLHDKGLCFYSPLAYHEIPSWYMGGHVTCDVAMIKVGPMDKHGYFNLGPSCSVTPFVCDAAKIVIAEVNESIPRCLGGEREVIHISDIDFLVETDNKPLLNLPEIPVTDVDNKVADLIMEELVDGACIQLGIGAMPNAIGAKIAESDLKDCGVHTEMLVDSFVDMYMAGKLTGKRKTLQKGKMTYTFAMGTDKLYNFLDNNPVCNIFPVNYTNHPSVIAKNDNVAAVNNAVEVDLFGQVCSESSGVRQISGTGGQFDYIFGAYKSNGGKAFICLSSTVKSNGTVISRIKPTLTPGATVTIPRSVTSYIVTEYGVVNIKGKSTYERAEAIIGIAHPDFRDELIKEAEAMKIWRRNNKK
jgi:butyryl-CoA:acetate CoA-transferase